jgi:hypothetical protein
MYDLMVYIDRIILKLLGFDRTGFFVWFYAKYIPERATLLKIFFSLFCSIERLYEEFAKSQRKIKAIFTIPSKTEKVFTAFRYQTNIIEKTIGTSSSYFQRIFLNTMDLKNLFSTA